MKLLENWFLAELIFRLHDNTHPAVHHFDKYYFPIVATSEKEAYQRALLKASAELDNRRDYTKEYLQWEFVGLESLAQIEKVSENAYHQTIRVPDDIPGFIHSLRQRNQDIQIRLTEIA